MAEERTEEQRNFFNKRKRQMVGEAVKWIG